MLSDGRVNDMKNFSTTTIQNVFNTRFIFFTGKGGVGKTSIASAVALNLADSGKSVLLVSTDPASNLDETLGLSLTNHPQQVPQVKGLDALNINPDQAAEDYRERVIAPLKTTANAIEITGLREQLSGACTVEIAAFDEFTVLLADPKTTEKYDHVIFDTAPTGHTLRLLSLPQAWTDFFDINERGASCIGPHSALKSQEDRFAMALQALQDPARTTVVLVARPEKSTLDEAARSSDALQKLGLAQQILIINGVFIASNKDDLLAVALEKKSAEALAHIPASITTMERFIVPLKPFNTVGLAALRHLFTDDETDSNRTEFDRIYESSSQLQATFSLNTLAKDLARQGSGLVLVMGKGGVGKTTIAAGLAVAIAKQGASVHLSTTDPAAHLAKTIEGSMPNLTVSSISPFEETKAYTEKNPSY